MLKTLKSRLMRLLPSGLAGRLRAWRIRRLIQSYPVRIVEHNYGRSRLKVELADPLAQGWYDCDWPELPEIHALEQSRLKPGAVVFDLGAHQGVVAAMLATVVGPTGRVIAVEANPHNRDAAIRNRDLNGLKQIEILQAAVSDRLGTLEFNESFNGQVDDGQGAWGRITVPATTIDTLVQQHGRPDVVFLDIEGAECLALSAAKSILTAPVDFFVEAHVGCGLEKLGGSVDKLLAYFPERDYTLQIRSENESSFRPLRADDPLLKDRFFLVALRRPA